MNQNALVRLVVPGLIWQRIVQSRRLVQSRLKRFVRAPWLSGYCNLLRTVTCGVRRDHYSQHRYPYRIAAWVDIEDHDTTTGSSWTGDTTQADGSQETRLGWLRVTLLFIELLLATTRLDTLILTRSSASCSVVGSGPIATLLTPHEGSAIHLLTFTFAICRRL